MSWNDKRAAFTLIELLVVVAIVAVLAAVLLPALGRARRQARHAACLSNLHQIDLGFAYYRADHRDIYPAAQDPLSSDPYYWLWMGRGFRALAGPYIVQDIDANSPSVLRCPADRTPKDLYEHTSYAYSMAFYHSPEQINAMTSTDWTYVKSRAESALKRPRGQSSGDVRYPAAKILVGDWGSYHDPAPDDNGWWDDDGFGGYLLADGHAEMLRAEQIRPAGDGKPHPNLTIDGVRGRDVDSPRRLCEVARSG